MKSASVPNRPPQKCAQKCSSAKKLSVRHNAAEYHNLDFGEDGPDSTVRIRAGPTIPCTSLLGPLQCYDQQAPI
jgi:hypothetical protein